MQTLPSTASATRCLRVRGLLQACRFQIIHSHLWTSLSQVTLQGSSIKRSAGNAGAGMV